MKKAYPKYSKTRIPWLQFMPDHWDDVKVKFLFRERVEKGFPEEPLLAATQTQGVVPKELYENRTVTAQKDFHLLKLVKVGDFVISLRSFQGGIEYAYYRGIISPAYTVMKPLPEVFGGYFRYLFKSKHFVDDLTTYVTGIREGQNIDYSEFRDSFQPLPPLPEQRQIAAFLDHKCALIDTFIQKKTRLIELLKEQKQAIINKAVTKGIDPNVRLKPSGIDWLGDIPEHWEVKKLKYVATLLFSNVDKNSFDNEEEVSLCNYVDVYRNEFIERSIEFMKATATDYEIQKFSIQKGDVLATKDSETPEDIAVPALVNETFKKVLCGYHLALIRTNAKRMLGEYLFRLFQSKDINTHFETSASGITRYGLSISAFNNVALPLPPTDEQSAINNHIKNESEVISAAISHIEREITLLQEYKTTLIAETVTGKIDVRDWKPKQVAEETEQTLNQVKAYGSN